jgi:hypothetical protein
MPPVGVGEGWTPSAAEALLLELNGTHAHDLPIAEAALNLAAGTDTARISQLENALRVEKEEHARVAFGLKRLQDGSEVADLKESLAKAQTELGIANVTAQSHSKRVGELEEQVALYKERAKAKGIDLEEALPAGVQPEPTPAAADPAPPAGEPPAPEPTPGA